MTRLSDFEQALVRSLYPDYSGESWKDDNARDIAADVEPLIDERVRLVQEQAWNEGWQRGFRDLQAATEDAGGYLAVTPSKNPYTQGDKQA